MDLFKFENRKELDKLYFGHIRVKCFRKLILFIRQVSELKPRNKSLVNFLNKISIKDIKHITEAIEISERMGYDYLETMQKIFGAEKK